MPELEAGTVDGVSEEKPDLLTHGFALLSKYRGAIMGFAAIYILIFHEWQYVFTDYENAAVVESYIKRIGFLGVDIFFFLSGIGLTFSIKKGSLLSFYWRRLKRIILPFLAMGILRCVLEDWQTIDFVKNLTGYNFYFKSIYSFLWFVPAIITFYLLFPLYHWAFSRAKKPVIFTLSVLGIWLVLSLYVREIMRGDLYGFTNRIPIFVIGILIGWLTQKKKDEPFTRSHWFLIAVLFVLGLHLAYLTNFEGLYVLVPTSNCCVPNMLIAVSLPFLMAKLLDILSNCQSSKAVSWIGKGLTAFLKFFGMFSLEFYCVQEWLAGKLIPVMQTDGYRNLVINLAVFAAVTAAAFAAHMVFVGFWKLTGFIYSKVAPIFKPIEY